jgi:hypothetical protein
MATQENSTTVPVLGNETQLMTNRKPMPVDEVVALFKCASDRFGELSALFAVLGQRKHETAFDIVKLASLGRDAASDYENMCGMWSEQVDDSGVSQ